MATAVASRFAVLSIDDEADDPYARKKLRKKVEADPTKAKTAPASQQSKQVADPKKKKKNPNKKTENTNQAQNNGPGKPKKAANGTQKSGGQSKSKKPAGQSEEQWEEWKKKDQEFVSDAYESDILQAVLQSKMEFEQRSKVVKTGGADDGQPPGGKGKGKRGKPQTMSLEQFNNPSKEEETDEAKEDDDDEEFNRLFFAQVNEDARRAISHEMLQEQTRVRQAYVQEAVTISQFQNILEKRDLEIAVLKDEVSKLRNELKDVRARNSKLCTILAQGEMKDKVGALLEVERLQSERNELVSEVQNLSTQLEQERSKVHALSSSMDKKTKGKKKSPSESTDK